MEREILRYLYDNFYKKGDYHFHNLAPIFDRLKIGWDYKEFLFKLISELKHLQNTTVVINGKYVSWGTIDAGKNVYFDYTNQPIKAKILPKGVEMIERVLSDERQAEVNRSVIETNNISKYMSFTSAGFAFLTVVISLAQCLKKDPINSSDIDKIQKSILELKLIPKNIDTIYLLNPPSSTYFPDSSKKK